MDQDQRVVPCADCGGDGGFERIHNDEYPSSYNGDPRRSWQQCTGCDGTGEIIIVASLIDHLDLDRPELTGRWPEPPIWDDEP